MICAVRVRPRVLAVVAALLSLSACADVDRTAPTSAVLESDAIAAGVRPGDDAVLGVYGIADARRSRACRSARFRELDFWLGEWNTTRPNGLSGGESSITGALNGCAIDERYNGGVGRSISRYDRITGKWQQDYIDTTGFTLRLSGALDAAGAMQMADSIRAIPNGPALASTFVWTPNANATVRQIWNFSLDGGATFAVNSNLVYSRSPMAVMPPAPTRSRCTDRPADRVLDGLLGRWRVRDQYGRRLGETSIALGAGGCVLEESFRGPLGYRMTSFLYRDRFVGRWYRAHADNASNTFRTAGTMSGTALQMTGSAPGPGAKTVPVRLTIDLADPMHPLQRWELRTSSGAWVAYAQLTWTRVE
jgi:hypothetical protein